MRKYILFITATLGLSPVTNAQITIPKYNFETPDDYIRCNDAILQCCSWLMYTPLDEAAYMIDEVIGFVVEWSMGSPDVLILVDDHFMPYIRTSPPLVAWHIAGSVKYQLERGTYATTVEELRESTLAGVNAVLDYYTANRHLLNEDKHIEKLLKTRRKRRLEQSIAGRIKQDIPHRDDPEIKP